MDIQLVHWLLVLEAEMPVGDSVLTDVSDARVRRSLFRFEGVHCTRSSWRSLPRRPRARTLRPFSATGSHIASPSWDRSIERP
jgi:hypothetical protein